MFCFSTLLLSLDNDLFYLFCNVSLICLGFSLKWSCCFLLFNSQLCHYGLEINFFFFFPISCFPKGKLSLKESYL